MDSNAAALLAGAKSKDMSKVSLGQLKNAPVFDEKMTAEQLHQLGFTGSKEDIIAAIKKEQDA
jgi:succinylarginine dihydrolase